MATLFGLPIVFSDKVPKLPKNIVLGNFDCFIAVEITCPDCNNKFTRTKAALEEGVFCPFCTYRGLPAS